MGRSVTTRGPGRLLAPASLLAVTVALILVIAAGGARSSRSLPDAQAANATRAAVPKPAAPATVTIGWAGDVVLGSRHGIPPNGGRDLLAGVRPVLRRQDLMIGNLEGVIGTGGVAKCPMGTPDCFAFQAPPVAAGTLAWAGFDVMSLANNHANDYGEAGLAETTAHLDAAGLVHSGLGPQVTVSRRRGVAIAVLGFAAYAWAARLDDIPAAVALVRRARRVADIVVVTMHAGAEGVGQLHTPFGPELAFGEDRGDTRAFAHAVVDAGADAVLGSGPHVIRGVELRRGAPIVYSTGNLAGFHTFPTTGALALSAIIELKLDTRGRLRSGRWTPVRISPPGRPALDLRRRESTALAARLSVEDFSSPGLRPDGRIGHRLSASR